MNRLALTLGGIFLLLCSAISAGAQVGHPSAEQKERTLRPSSEVIADALYCMVTGKNYKVGGAAAQRTYDVRYVYGVVDPNVDRPNELHIVSYGTKETSAWLCELLVEPRNDGGYVFTWVNSARLRRKKGIWVVEDTLGGIYSYRRVQKLAERISREKQISISLQNVNPADLICKSH